MKNITDIITETQSINEDNIDAEMKKWEERFKSPFGKALKELQWTINDEGLYDAEKNEYGFYTFTPFDNYVTAFALDGNKKYTYKKVKAICDDWDWSDFSRIKKILKKLEKLSNE